MIPIFPIAPIRWLPTAVMVMPDRKNLRAGCTGRPAGGCLARAPPRDRPRREEDPDGGCPFHSPLALVASQRGRAGNGEEFNQEVSCVRFDSLLFSQHLGSLELWRASSRHRLQPMH